MKPRWTEFEAGTIPPDVKFHPDEKCWINNRYQVVVTPLSEDWVHLSIKRRDKNPVHDWRDFQRIKNELVGPEAEAVELYPAESRMVDNANQYHLWCVKRGQFPFGFSKRLVSEGRFKGVHGTSCQRPWAEGERPADCLDEETANKLVMQHYGEGRGRWIAPS